MKQLKLGLSLIAVLFLTGCVTCARNGYVIPESSVVKLDERLLADCADLPNLAGPTDEDISKWAKEVIENQADCRSRKNKQTTIIRELLNQKK